ncbi:hypothetical protein POL68_20055 [Stigmatella sp. ncwal1]|uniref:Secreted protein n=1 Tax=Stigmatella ashevillensis TaxID=2995309 RepID=A0ABT5DB77_9BACT|nr:hypothetical protein [Stigmatella ashevillena]MDC0710781.1 hypothetical protein [Stigmatella ashevillena]
MLRSRFILLALSMSWAACGVAPEEQEPTPGVEASADGSVEAQWQVSCEPGPPSNFCDNVAGKACSTTATRRCYLPNYCEWFFCRCINGTWTCE